MYLSDQAKRRLGQALAFVVLSAAVVPLWIVDYPPMQDVPQHLAAVRVLHSYGEPGFNLAEYFTVHLARTQYLAYYLLCDWLSFFLTIQNANLVLASLTVLGIPYGARSVLGALGSSRSLALMLVPLTYNAHLVLGFLNFLAAIPLMLFGLSVAIRLRRRPSAPLSVFASLLAIVCFYMHVVPCALLAVGVVLVSMGQSVRTCLRCLTPMIPLGLAGGYWLWTSPAGRATVGAAGLAQSNTVPATFRSPDQAWAELPMWLTDVLTGDDDLLQLKAWGGLFAVAVILGVIWRRRRMAFDGRPVGLALRLWLLPLLCAVGYLYLPSGFRWIWPIAERFGLLALVLAVPLLPPLRQWAQAVVLCAALLLSATHLWSTGRAFLAFETEVGQFDRALDSIPPGQRVAGLIFDRGSRHVRFSPFLHFVAYYQARKGGAVMFTFADFPQSPFAFRAERRPPKVRPRWEWMPARVNPKRDLGFYRYVLVRGGPGAIGRPASGFERIFRSRHWSVFKRR